MGMTMKAEGLDDVSRMLTEMGEAAQGIAAASLYEGAGVMADFIWDAIGAIKTAPFKYVREGTRLPSPEEKAALMEGEYGIAKFSEDGSEITTSVGYNGGGYVNVNFNHMSSKARTNYKAFEFKGNTSNSSSLLKYVGKGKGAQNQKPVGAIANAINSGTSFIRKQPFMRQGISKGTAPAKAAIVKKAEDMINNITK